MGGRVAEEKLDALKSIFRESGGLRAAEGQLWKGRGEEGDRTRFAASPPKARSSPRRVTRLGVLRLLSLLIRTSKGTPGLIRAALKPSEP